MNGRTCDVCGATIGKGEQYIERDGLLDYPESDEHRREVLCASCGSDYLAMIEEANSNPAKVDEVSFITNEVWDAVKGAMA